MQDYFRHCVQEGRDASRQRLGEAGADVHVDVASLLPYHESNGSHVSHDGLHLTRAGYDALGSRLGSAIARALTTFIFHEATLP